MELIKTSVLASALGMSKKSVLEKARQNGWAYVEKNGAWQFVENRLPTDVRFAVAAYKSGAPVVKQKVQKEVTSERELVGDNFLNASDKAQSVAQFRAALIHEWQSSGLKVLEFVEVYNSGAYPGLFQKLGEVSKTTFYRWVSEWKKFGASGVVPKYGASSGGAGESLLDEERELLKRFWLVNTQPSMMHAYRLMKANLPYSEAKYQTCVNYLNSIPKAIAGFHRLGAGRFENLFLPHMEQNIERYKSLEVAVSDHHCLDCVVMYHGELVRPWLTTFQDLRSGKILGFCPSIKPSSMSIVVAYYMMCMRYGIPNCCLFDNGKDYRGKWLNGHTETAKVFSPEGWNEEIEIEFQGVFGIVGSEVRFTRTYNGKSKARQERYFRIIGEYFAKDFGTYVGSDSRTRPEDAALMWRAIDGKEQRQDIPAWEEFCSSIESVIELINDTFESHGVGMNGKTRSQVFLDNLPPEEMIRKPTVELLQKALLKGEVRKVGRNGVKVGGVNYYHEALFEFVGRDVRVYKDLLSAEVVTICDLQGDLICKAQANYFKETGYLENDLKRLEGARAKLSAIAERGSGEVNAAIEYQTMIDVASRTYGNNAIEGVDQFLGYTEEKDVEVEKPKQINNQTKLKSLLDADDDDYAMEA